MADWQVGQTVVCVYSGFLDESDAPELVEGDAYTVTGVLPPRRGFHGLQLAGVPAKQRFRAFDERRFRTMQSASALPLLQRILRGRV